MEVRKGRIQDVDEKNAPAIRLYEKFGFCYIDTVDLGYSDYGLEKFKLYQRILQSGDETFVMEKKGEPYERYLFFV